MSARLSSWLVPVVGLVIGLLMAAALLAQHATLGSAAISFAIVVAYALAMRALQSRSDLARVLSGVPPDERWVSINDRALAAAAQVLAVLLVGAFLVVEFSGNDAGPYAWLGAAFGVTYLGGLVWFRARS